MTDLIDLRSDTATRPTEGMKTAMAQAEVGDDVYGEDPSVNALEVLAAERLGTEAAVYAASGTQANLMGILSHCERGDEYIVGQNAHTYRFEGGGAAVLGSVQPQPIEMEADGTLDLQRVAQVVKPDDFHFARTKLLCLENTHSGKVLPLDYLAKASDLAEQAGLGLHLDGARAFNAAVELGVDIGEIARHFDTVSICLSKGLGAPVGSVLCGPRHRINSARRWRKVLGGGMRQAGSLAAAGIYALNHHVARLAEDHENARHLADALRGMAGIEVHPTSGQTNMVFISLTDADPAAMAAFLASRGVVVSVGKNPIRLVTHLDVSRSQIDTVVEHFHAFFTQGYARAS